MEQKKIHRPSDYEYAVLAQQAYQGEALKPNQRVPQQKDWRVCETLLDAASAYFGVIYINHKTEQVVLAHRGTNRLGALLEDVRGIYLNGLSPQKEQVYAFTQAALTLAQEEGYALSFTGHSLGAFLAELSVYYCHRSFEMPQVHAVTFESPGSYESLENLQPNHPQGAVDVDRLDVVSYLSYPNLVNTCNRHVGTLYALAADLGTYGWVPGWYTKQAHSLEAIVHLFEQATHTCPYIQDWSVGTSVIPGGESERDYFFKYAIFENGQYRLPQEKQDALTQHLQATQHFALDFKAHYRVHSQFHHRNLLPLIHFPAEVGTWLKAFYKCYGLYVQAYGREAVLPHFSDFVKKEKIAEDVCEALLATQVLDRHSKKLVYMATQDANIVRLRHTLSTWFAHQPQQAGKLLSFVLHFGKEIQETPDLEAIIRENVTIHSGALVEGKAFGIYTEFPEGADPATIDGLNQVVGYQLEKVKALGVKIKVTGMKGGYIEPQAKVSDTVASVGSRAEVRPTPSPYPPLWQPSPSSTNTHPHSDQFNKKDPHEGKSPDPKM